MKALQRYLYNIGQKARNCVAAGRALLRRGEENLNPNLLRVNGRELCQSLARNRRH